MPGSSNVHRGLLWVQLVVLWQSCSLCSSGESPTMGDRSPNLANFPFEICNDIADGVDLLLFDGSAECGMISNGFSRFCGCPLEEGQPEPSCSVCRDGSSVPLPNTTIGVLARLFFGSQCGCPSRENHCEFRPGEDIQEKDYNIFVPDIAVFLGLESLTCFDVKMFQKQLRGRDELCWLGQGANYICGCSDGLFTYLDSSSVKEQAAFAWVPQISAILAMIGSCSIMAVILTKKSKRKTVYSQLVLAISIFDFVGSIAWATSTAAIPEYDNFGQEVQIYGANGNDATCKLQGFLIQLNYTGIFYNVSHLPTIFWLSYIAGEIGN